MQLGKGGPSHREPHRVLTEGHTDSSVFSRRERAGMHGPTRFNRQCPSLSNVLFWATSPSPVGLLILSSTLKSLFWHFQGSKKCSASLPDIYSEHGKVSLQLVFTQPLLLPAGFWFRTLAPEPLQTNSSLSKPGNEVRHAPGTQPAPGCLGRAPGSATLVQEHPHIPTHHVGHGHIPKGHLSSSVPPSPLAPIKLSPAALF